MKRIIYILLSWCFLINGCKSHRELGNHYYCLDDYDAMDIGYPGSIIYKSSKMCNFENIIIYSRIIDCKSDDNYIIVKQEPNLSILYKEYKDDVLFWLEYLPKKANDSWSVLNKKYHNQDFKAKFKRHNIDSNFKKMMKTDSFLARVYQHKINYFVIDKSNDKINGPFNLKEFHTFKNRNNISLSF